MNTCDQYKVVAKQLQSTLRVVENENTELRRLNNELRSECDRIKTEMEDRYMLNDKLALVVSYRKQIKQLQAENDRLNSDNEELKKELDKFKSGIIDVSEYYPD